MSRRRAFNRAERMALFIAAGGKCTICGMELGDTWEADHVQAYSKGGKTNILNGQALCRDCNRKKGVNQVNDKIKLRPFQQEFVDRAIAKVQSGGNVLVAYASAGSGKTLGSQAAADSLLRDGFIEQVMVLVPRLNLAQQYELDWQGMQPLLDWKPTLRKILHRPNSLNRLIPANADGYVTTYQSLCANPKKHIEVIASKPTLLILDEAQQLGYDEFGRDTTKSAYWVEELGKHAKMIFVMSGTPYRSDNQPLLFASYGEPQDDNYRPLMADLEATYRDGVRERYLRRFEYRLADGGYTWNDMSGDDAEYTISDPEASVYHALQLEGVWQPLIDKFIDTLQWQRETVHKRFAGLVACLSQKQARLVMKYINKQYSELRVLIAISEDGEKAHKSLKKFKTGNYDVLVTVAMAYVGYDYKWINAVALLTPIRSRGYLMQLVARGLRVISSIDYGKQHCYIIAPDDPKMTEFVDYMRSESDAGYTEIIKDDPPTNGGNQKKKGHTLGYAANGFISELRALGIDPNSDLTPEELIIANQVQRANGYPYAATEMVAIYRMMSKAFATPQPIVAGKVESPELTETEKMTDAKSWIDTQVGKLAYKIAPDGSDAAVIGRHKVIVSAALKRVYSGGIDDADTIDELRERAGTVLRWQEQGYADAKR